MIPVANPLPPALAGVLIVTRNTGRSRPLSSPHLLCILRGPLSFPPRRFPRVKVLGSVTGEASFLQDVTLLDLSGGGARLEHTRAFALNALCYLRLPAPEGELVLKARIVHSAVSRTVPGPGEGTTLLFQSGVEFVGLTSDALLALRQLLTSLDRPPDPS